MGNGKIIHLKIKQYQKLSSRIITNCGKMLSFSNSDFYSQASLHFLGFATKSISLALILICIIIFSDNPSPLLSFCQWLLVTDYVISKQPSMLLISTYKFFCCYVFIQQTDGDDWCGWRLAQDWREMEEGGHTSHSHYIGDNSTQCQCWIFCFIGLESL